MSRTLTTGSKFSIAAAYAAAVDILSITNASEAVATLDTGHGVTVGKILEISSGWSRIDGMLARAKAVVSDNVTLELIDTSSLENFPVGFGVGSVRLITSWAEISQVRADGISSSGGEQQFIDLTEVEDEEGREAPTTRSPQRMTLVTHDDTTLPWYPVVKAADDTRTPVGYQVVFRNGSRLLANALWSLPRVPQMDGVLKTALSIAFASRSVRYAT
jgi:hypothetical protein